MRVPGPPLSEIGAAQRLLGGDGGAPTAGRRLRAQRSDRGDRKNDEERDLFYGVREAAYAAMASMSSVVSLATTGFI